MFITVFSTAISPPSQQGNHSMCVNSSEAFTTRCSHTRARTHISLQTLYTTPHNMVTFMMTHQTVSVSTP